MAEDSDYKLKCDASLSEEIENVITSPFSAEEEKALVRKVDLTLLPTIWIMYLLSYMDRTNIGNAKISGMQEDLDLTSDQYSIALVVFFIGYVVFEVPSKRLSERERHVAIARLATDNVTSLTEDSPELSYWNAVVESAKDWRTWGFVVGYMVIVGSSTLSYFYPTLVKGLFGDSSTERVNFLTVPIYAVAFVCTAITAYFSDKIPQWRGLVIAGWLSASLACSIAVCVVYNYTARYVLLVLMAAGLWATNGGTLAYASSAFANMHPQKSPLSQTQPLYNVPSLTL
ncbi:vitamin H transporter [Aspergillus luchuensis]|uniref:Vitamin H transporter n=1 Tax=Aspergillus kawachii TaxID=1069201 RepID=A0A146FN37_ASPKA|nr:vitamin H transporter [Aspergillus luchuensis]